jgi:hypothetical protein
MFDVSFVDTRCFYTSCTSPAGFLAVTLEEVLEGPSGQYVGTRVVAQMRFAPRDLTLALAFLQVTQALRVTDSGTRRRFELLLLLSGWAFLASELVDSEDWAGTLVEEGRILRKDIVRKVCPRPYGCQRENSRAQEFLRC